MNAKYQVKLIKIDAMCQRVTDQVRNLSEPETLDIETWELEVGAESMRSPA